MGTQLALFAADCLHRNAELRGSGWLWCPDCQLHCKPPDVDPVATYAAETPKPRKRAAAEDA